MNMNTTIKITRTRGFNDSEYAAMKQTIKTELSFTVSVRRHKTKSSYGAIDIRPRATTHWTPEQTIEVYNFVKRHNLHTNMIDRIPEENIPYVFHQGFGYIDQKIS